MYSIGVDIGGTKIAAGLIDDRGKILKFYKCETEAKKSKEIIVKNILNAINSVYDKKLIKKNNFRGIGIGVPGNIDEKGNIIQLPNVPKLRNINLKEYISKKYKCKSAVNNDANCFALSEAVFGAGKGKKNVVGVIIGTGVGSGIITDQKIYNGTDFLAGEFGMIPYNNKIIEEFCAWRFVKRRLKQEKINIHYSDLFKTKNNKITKIFNEYSKHLAQLCAIIICSVNPDVIVFGGGVAEDFDNYKKSLKKELNKLLKYKRTKKTLLKRKKLESPGIRGAALLLRQ
ncbi:ROK family protein [Nanoarchaeota archaeon]